jgi:hypothetical protein
MRWLLAAMVPFALGATLIACNGEESALKEGAAKGTACPPDKVQVKDVTRQYGNRVQMGFALYQVNVCGGGWRTFCLQRGVNAVTAGEENCLQ